MDCLEPMVLDIKFLSGWLSPMVLKNRILLLPLMGLEGVAYANQINIFFHVCYRVFVFIGGLSVSQAFNRIIRIQRSDVKISTVYGQS